MLFSHGQQCIRLRDAWISYPPSVCLLSSQSTCFSCPFPCLFTPFSNSCFTFCFDIWAVFLRPVSICSFLMIHPSIHPAAATILCYPQNPVSLVPQHRMETNNSPGMFQVLSARLELLRQQHHGMRSNWVPGLSIEQRSLAEPPCPNPRRFINLCGLSPTLFNWILSEPRDPVFQKQSSTLKTPLHAAVTLGCRGKSDGLTDAFTGHAYTQSLWRVTNRWPWSGDEQVKGKPQTEGMLMWEPTQEVWAKLRLWYGGPW